MWRHSLLGNRAFAMALACVSLFLAGFAEPSYEELCQQGRGHLLAKQYVDAERTYSRAMEAQPGKPLAHVGQALAFRAQQKFSETVDASNRAIQADPREVVALVIRGTAYHALGKHKLAMEDFDDAIHRDPKEAFAYASRARVYLDQGDQKQAMYDLSKAIEFEKKDASTYVARAKLYRRRGHFGNAARDYEEAIRIRPKSAPYRFLLAQVHFDNRNYDPAIEAASKAIELNERFAAAHVLKGAALYHQSKLDEAMDALKEAERITPMDAGAYLWLGKTRLELGELEQAKADLAEALRIDDKYVAAHRALAGVYEKLEQPDMADASRETARTLETELRKADALGRDFAEDASPSRIAATDDFDPTTISTESLRSQVPPAELLTKKVREAAEIQRRPLAPLRRDLKACEATSVIPKLCADADDLYQQSVNLFDVKKFETAAIGFEKSQGRYRAALEAFEEVAGRDHVLWLDWARKKAEGDLPRDRKAPTWAVLAEAAYLTGDQEGYRDAIRLAVSGLKARGIVDPKAGATALLSVADVQARCGDRSGAKSSVLAAADFCEGIQDVGPKSFRLARCAGFLARLGENDEWTRRMHLALNTAETMGRPKTPERAYQPLFVRCIGYAEAWSADEAATSAEMLGTAFRRPYGPNLADWAAPAHASVVLAAAMSEGEGDSGETTFYRSYTAACTHLATFLKVRAHGFNASLARHLLATADAHSGHCERAWVSAVNIPDPETRAMVMARILRTTISLRRWDRALQMAELVPEDPSGTEALCWSAVARVRQDGQSMVELKQWAEKRSGLAGRSVALAGIAVGVKARTDDPSKETSADTPHRDSSGATVEQVGALAERGDHLAAARAFASIPPENRSDARLCELFDRSAAAVPHWWLEQAADITNKVEEPCVRARLWLLLARAHREANDQSDCRTAVAEAVHCTTAIWSRILARRGDASRGHDGTFRWQGNSVSRKSEKAEIHSMLNMLMALESFQHEIGDRAEAFDTLLLALKCVETMPRDSGYSSPATPDSLATWLSRIAGRAQLRGRRDIAEIIMRGFPWSQVQATRGTDTFLMGLAAAEAQDAAELEELAEEMRRRATTSLGGSSSMANYAALLYAKMSLLAARKGDENRYRQAAMKVGGLVNTSRGSASRAILLRLAEATAALGETDVAHEYIDQSKVHGAERDAVVVGLVTAMCHDGRISEATRLLEKIHDEEAKVQAWYAVAKAEADEPSARLSSLFEQTETLAGEAEKAAALAGVASALLTK